MPKRSLSVLKRTRQNEKRRLRNRKQKRTLKDKVKEIMAASDKDAALKLLPEVQSLIDKSARKGLMHRNAARRLKSKLTRELPQKD